MHRVGRTNEPIYLRAEFYVNGVPFTPYDVGDVEIYDAETGGNLLATITPTLISVGIYEIVWDVPQISSRDYYDRWTWTPENGMDSLTQVYDFRIDARPGLPTGKCSEGPLFIGGREINFFNSVTKELIQKVVGSKIVYYAISEEHTNTHSLYKESIRKTSYLPVVLNALVFYDEPVQTADKFTIDTITRIECYFHVHELEERTLIPREGDFVKWGEIVYEIEHLTKPQLTYGQILNKVMVKATCRTSRKSQFEVLDEVPSL